MSSITIEATIAEVRRLAKTMPEHKAVAYIERWEDETIAKAVAAGKLTYDVGGPGTCTYIGHGNQFTYLEVWERDGDAMPMTAMAYVTTPRCIIGTAVHNLGYSDTSLETFEDKSAWNLMVGLAGDSDWQKHKDLVHWLDKVQRHQDQGEPWAEAVRLADTETEEAHE